MLCVEIVGGTTVGTRSRGSAGLSLSVSRETGGDAAVGLLGSTLMSILLPRESVVGGIFGSSLTSTHINQGGGEVGGLLCSTLMSTLVAPLACSAITPPHSRSSGTGDTQFDVDCS